jgi:hypothetical protein
MVTKTTRSAKKTTRPRTPTLKQLVVRTQAIQAKVNELVTELRRLDRQKLVITTEQSGQSPKPNP